MKEQFEVAVLSLIPFESCDVITISGTDQDLQGEEHEF